MSENIKQDVDTSSFEFKQGVEAGLNSKEDTENWQAGNELGRELKKGENTGLVSEGLFKEPSTPLFMKDNPGQDEGNAQDEKDGTEE